MTFLENQGNSDSQLQIKILCNIPFRNIKIK